MTVLCASDDSQISRLVVLATVTDFTTRAMTTTRFWIRVHVQEFLLLFLLLLLWKERFDVAYLCNFTWGTTSLQFLHVVSTVIQVCKLQQTRPAFIAWSHELNTKPPISSQQAVLVIFIFFSHPLLRSNDSPLEDKVSDRPLYQCLPFQLS